MTDRILHFARRRLLLSAALRTLTTAAMTPLWAACAPGQPAPLTSSLQRRAGIDVHCHVFNASDLPVSGFVRRVVLGEGEHQVVFSESGADEGLLVSGLADFLVRILSQGAISARREAERLRSGERPPGGKVERRTREQAILKDALFSLSAAPMPAPPGTPEVGREFALPSPNEALLREILSEVSLPVGARPEEVLVTNAVAEELLVSDGKYGRSARWALMLLRSREEIVEELDRLYGGEGGMVLFTPSLVDFSHWLDSDPISPLEDQLVVMDLIQRRRTSGAMVHSFVAFDPWRQIVDEEASVRPFALDLVEYAIMEAGFVGVKLYPPMGFLPAGNAGSQLPYPKRAEDIVEFPRKLDASLEKLFAWCEAKGVPVMAHATNSNGANAFYGQRADPRNWIPVLRKHPQLRLNLGHFGGFDEARGGGAPESTWEWAIGGMEGEISSPLFSDLSYLSEALAREITPDIRPRLRSLLKRYVDLFDPNVKRLLYGSDWIMLGREKDHEHYPGIIEEFLDETGLNQQQVQRFFMTNAIDFLGLRSGNESRGRLNAYYRSHGLDADRLRVFDY